MENIWVVNGQILNRKSRWKIFWLNNRGWMFYVRKSFENFIINKKVLSQEDVLKIVVGKWGGKNGNKSKESRLESWCEKF